MTLEPRASGPSATFAPALVLTVSLALSGFLVVMALLLLVAHPQTAGLGAAATVANQQNQNAKTVLYVVAFLILLPGAVILVPRLADRIAAGPSADALAPLSYALAGGICLLLVIARISSRLPWGDGIGVILALFVPGLGVAVLLAGQAARPRSWRFAEALAGHERTLAVVAAALAFAAVLCVTRLGSVSDTALVLGTALLCAALALGGRVRGLPRMPRLLLGVADLAVVVVIVLAVVNVVIYHSAGTRPNAFFPPGVYQFQQDWIIGPANQLTAGGAVMVNDPVSQYGVGMLYFLAGWFHLAPIGYGTFGLLDGMLTALVYCAGYAVLRLAGARRWLAASTLALAVLVFAYHLIYPVGTLPEQGPLRFGMPMALLLARVLALRWPGGARAARALALLVLAVAAVWALEAFAYTALTYLVIGTAEAALEPTGHRRARLVHDLALGFGAIVLAHLVFALATLAGSGHLPAWRDYLAYIHSLLFGGKEGSITYGFEPWSPGLAMGVAAAGSAAATVLLISRAREFALEHRVTVVALAGMTMYEIAVFSYTDSRASTYLLPYVALPLLLAAALWLVLLGRLAPRASGLFRGGVRALAGAIAVVMLAAAWPTIGHNFSQSALARAYPGGGLRAAVSRLWHSPVIDPRAPDGQRILTSYFPRRRAIVVLPTAQDLGIEILMRGGKANRLFIGDPIMDDFIPQIWVPRIGAEIAALRPGTRLLTNTDALALLASVQGQPPFNPLAHETGSALPSAVYNAPELVWTLQQIERRYVLRPLYSDSAGYVVLQVLARR
ncbi:MAG: hypothetical protein M3076_14105 [Actinomycetota bacterium]|nr:hypothetical protein [Actinomycetota bacterium]